MEDLLTVAPSRVTGGLFRTWQKTRDYAHCQHGTLKSNRPVRIKASREGDYGPRGARITACRTTSRVESGERATLQTLILRVLLGFVVLAAGSGFVWLWWVGVPLLYADVPDVRPPDRLTAVTATRTALLAGLVGVGAIGTFLVNSRTYRVTAQTFKITERGHLTERYAKAIEHLGSDTLDVRLGGIYALEQLATDSERPQDQITIVEVLSAFVRVRSQPLFRYKQDQKDGRLTPPSVLAEDETLAVQALEYARDTDGPPVDVAAAVKVLGRLPPRRGVTRGDLSHAYLRGADFIGANFRGSILLGVTLELANLRGSDFSEATLAYAQMGWVWANDADFSEADLQSTMLRGAHVGGARLRNTKLFKANFDDVKGMTMDQVQSARIDLATVLPGRLRDQLIGEVSRSGESDAGTSDSGP